MTDSPQPCAMCGSTATNRAYYPVLLGWFCVGADGAACYDRKVQRESAPAVSRG